MTDAKKILFRLKRKFGKERARLERFYNQERERAKSEGRNPDYVDPRNFYEANIWTMAMAEIDKEVSKIEIDETLTELGV